GTRLTDSSIGSSPPTTHESSYGDSTRLKLTRTSKFRVEASLSEFQDYCSNAHIPLEVGRIYNPVRPGTGMWYGVTQAQRETLMRAVQGGYYSIPRRMSTQDLADDLGISDQAVTERLRRAIVALTENTLIAMEEELAEEFEHVPDS
ncbi:helix-turn-helix domain-containing protein, partial [Saliphagus infecundisoli]